jgi:predicted TIM-barrel fold metal-dependent hydrolase
MTGFADTHAHVFTPALPFVTPRRYTPAYSATIGQFLAHLDASGVRHGLLVQPSFLGNDNSHMLEAMAPHAERLRAVVMVDPAATGEALDALGAQGAIGVRLNLAGLPLPDLRAGPWPRLLGLMRERDWHLELHRDGRDLPGLIAPALEAGVRVCVDHFGRPDPAAPLEDAGFRSLQSVGKSGRVWVKLSGAYRNGGPARGEQVAMLLAPRLVDAFGPERLLWGSDWPHTQHESLVDHAGTFAALARWVTCPETRAAILARSAAQLFALQPSR